MRSLVAAVLILAVAAPAFAASRSDVAAALRSAKSRGLRGQALARHLASCVNDCAFSSPYRNSWLTSPGANSWLTSPFRDSPVSSPYHSIDSGVDYILRHANGH